VKCGSNTLIVQDNDAVCLYCGYIIKDFRIREIELGSLEFRKWYKSILMNTRRFKKELRHDRTG
jgi:hypothetical protein